VNEHVADMKKISSRDKPVVMRFVFLTALFLLSFSLFAQSEHYNFSKLDI
jgi:hypothetical protein